MMKLYYHKRLLQQIQKQQPKGQAMQSSPIDPSQQRPNNPMLILHRQLKDKSLKKSSLESLTTIALALGRKRTRTQLIPYLSSIFVEESTEIQKLILKGFAQLLHPIYIGKSHYSRLILEIVMDILCVYSNKEIRDEAYACLEKVFAFIDVRKAQGMLVQALLRLNNEEQDTNIRELVLKMIPYVIAGADEERQSQLLQILNSFKKKPADQKLLSEGLPEFIKVMPPAPQKEIREIISLLIKTGDKKILSNLIQSVILLAKASDEQSTIVYLKQILQQADSPVFCTALKKYPILSQIYKPQNLTLLTQKLTQYDSQPQQIKNTILQLLDSLPIDEENMIKLTEPPVSLQLKTTLSDTLCRVSDMRALLKLFNSSDPNFQAKLFPKLPPISQLHIQIVDKIMNSKSWRQKLTILQNIEARTEKGQATDMLIPKLAENLGDKIACVRVAVAEAIKNVMIRKRISVLEVRGIVEKSLDSKNWFQRQTVYKMLVDQAKQSSHNAQEKEFLFQICRRGSIQKPQIIKQMAAELFNLLSSGPK